MQTKKSLKILFVSSEVAPFAKSGGLADVAGSLPKVLAAKGNDVRIVMPRYQEIKITEDMKIITDFPVIMGQRHVTCIVRESKIDFKQGETAASVPVYFIDNYHYFDRGSMYCQYDDAERFVFLCKAILDMLPKIDFQPDIIHCNDWQSGPIAFLLKSKYKNDAYYKNIATLFTIHNLQYQGIYSKEILCYLNIDDSYFTPEQLEFYGQFNFMKAGILYGDIINTVSETYANEIQTQEYGERLEGVLAKRSKDLYGIVNGIDVEYFNPETDPMIYKNYNVETIEAKKENKYALQREVNLPFKDVPMIGLVHRLVSQKGLDLIWKISEKVMNLDLQFVVLGIGDPYYENMFKNMFKKYSDKMAVFIEFNEVLAHKIYAGSDMFLMPSAFEPCGLGQLMSLRYGTIPIARLTGGLADTVQNFDMKTGKGNGFAFCKYAPDALLKAIERAVKIYSEHPGMWSKLAKSALATDYSWSKQADKYIDLYRKAIRKKVGA